MQRHLHHTLRLPFVTPHAALYTAHPLEDRLTRALVACLCGAALLYLALVSQSIVNVIAAKEAARAEETLRQAVGTLERDYFALAQGVTESAHSLGLVSVSEKSYLSSPNAVARSTPVGSQQ